MWGGLTDGVGWQVPCKPIFFDLAFNYINMPDMSDRIEKKGGFRAAVGGLFGWGSKR